MLRLAASVLALTIWVLNDLAHARLSGEGHGILVSSRSYGILVCFVSYVRLIVCLLHEGQIILVPSLFVNPEWAKLCRPWRARWKEIGRY